MLLSEMKNSETCKHEKIAVEKIKTFSLDKPWGTEEIDLDKINGEEQEVVLCLECGKELERS